MSSAAVGQGGPSAASGPVLPESRSDTGAGMAVARQMFAADFLKLRRKLGTLIWAAVLALLPLLIFFVVRAILHSSSPHEHGPAGGTAGFSDGLRLLALFFGPLAAILIGVEAGSGDASAGVFRDLVVTGRSRLALFAARVPAALAMCWAVFAAAYAVLLAGTYAFASNLPVPDAALVLNGFGFLLLASGMVCAVAVGFASLTTSKPAPIIALIAWHLIASPLIAAISLLGSARDGVLSQALAHFSPVHIEGGGRGATVTMSTGTAVIVLVIWLAVFLALGAWRTRTMDA
jgi:ABC-type transport system involved in multi-copper enzyme maturation permease subunit